MRLATLSFALLASLLAGTVHAQSVGSYPNRPVILIVPFTPGGNTDISGRIIADALSRRMGQSFIVENRGGAGGMIGGLVAAQAKPDGYTLLLGASGPTTISPLLHKKTMYDPQRAFEPISLLSIAAIAIVAKPSLPVKTVADLIAMARAHPGALTVASAGIGTSGYLANELFQYMTGVQFSNVPYNGGGPAALAVVGGQVDLLFDQVTSTMGYAQQGQLRALAVTTAQRVAAYPKIPTVAESGVKGYQAETYTGLFAPAGTPQPIVDRLYAEVAKALADPAVIEKFAKVGAEAKSLPPSEFSKYLVQEHDKWAKVLKVAKITPD